MAQALINLPSTLHSPNTSSTLNLYLRLISLWYSVPHAIPAVNSQGDSASKQAKLDQLHAMQGAVRRMKQELHSDDVFM